jgi:hypothetical protein
MTAVQTTRSLSETSIGSAVKAQYHPTDPEIIKLVANEIKWTQHNRGYGRSYGSSRHEDLAPLSVLDPSCGKGTAIALLGKLLGATAYGNELARSRAKEAVKVLEDCTIGPVETLDVHGQVDVLFQNPPYDRGAVHRYEYEHILCGMKWLRGGGIYIAVLPEKSLDHKFLAMWVKYIDETQIWRTPPEIFKLWNQIVIMGKMRSYLKHTVYDSDLNRMRRLVEEVVVLGIEPYPHNFERRYTYHRNYEISLYNGMPKADVILADIAEFPPMHETDGFRKLTVPPPSFRHSRPAMPCRAGLVVQWGAAGMLTGQWMTIEGRPYLVSGDSYKHLVTKIEQTETSIREISTEKTAYVINCFSRETGRSMSFDSKRAQKEYAKFLMDNTQNLIDAVNASNPPAYQWDYSKFTHYFDQIHSPRVLPGVPPGLITAQKHVSAAMCGVLDRFKSGIVVGECGTGKTITMLSTMAIKAGWFDGSKTRVVVMCPAPVSPKWVAEATTILQEVPNFKAFLIGKERRQSTQVADRPEGYKEARVNLDIVALDAKVRNYNPAYKKYGRGIIDSEANLKRAYDRISDAKIDLLKLLDGSKSASVETRVQRQLCHLDEIIDWLQVKKDLPERRVAKKKIRKPILDTIRAWNHNGPALLVVPFEVAKNGSPWAHNYITKAREVTYTVQVERENRWGDRLSPEDIEVTEKAEVFFCPTCGKMLRDSVTAKPWSRGKKRENEFRTMSNQKAQRKCNNTIRTQAKVIDEETGEEKWEWQEVPCRSPLWTAIPFKKGGRWPVCEFISQNYADQYMVILDEAHNTKGGDTNIGFASADLIFGASKTVAMTGTIFNGYASSIFYLLYRLNGDFRNLYDHNEVSKFVASYGYSQTITTTSLGRSGRRTSGSGYTSTGKPHVRPAPGASPSIVAMLMEYTCWLRKSDLGIDLPPKIEIATAVDMSPSMAIAYRTLAKQESTVKRMFVMGKRGPLARWMQAALGYVDCPTEEVIEDVCALPTVHLEPGDQRRDSRQRISDLLTEEGIVHGILYRGKVKPDERMDWIRENVIKPAEETGQPPVLLGNMALVKEGVDLIEFSTMILTAPHYNIIELRQILDRIHRLGQTRDVHLIFPYYQNTHQVKAMSHIAVKLTAALQIDGEAAAGIAAFEQNEGDFIQELMREGNILMEGVIEKHMSTRVYDDVALVLKKPQDDEPITESIVVVPDEEEIEALVVVQTVIKTKGGHEFAQIGFQF